MALVRCPECNRDNVSDSAEACPNCGYGIRLHFEKMQLEISEKEKRELAKNEIENIETQTEEYIKPSYSKKKIGIIAICISLVLIFCVIIVNFINAKETEKQLNEIEMLVENGQYAAAWEMIDNDLLAKYGDEEYIEKAMIVGYMEAAYKEAPNSFTEYLLVILRSIGGHQKLIDWGLYDYTEKMVLDSVQQIENQRSKIWDDTVEEMILEKYNDPENKLVEPYRTENPDRAKDYIKFLISSIDETKTQEYEKEQYDKNNPLQITEKSVNEDDGYWYCNGTLSNAGSKTYYYVKVKVTYYDENMNVLTTDWTYAVDSVGIKGGENQQFEIMTKVNGDVEKYKVEVIEYQ